MSVVYLAYDPELDRKVALKLMRVTMLGEKGKLRLQREAHALARLSHPNVVPVYDAGTFGEQAFVAMEFVEGKTLRRWLKDEHAWREKLAVLLEAGRGLVAAHAAGLVHRDFKPDNVLIGDDARVRVADFGLARLVGLADGTAPSSHSSLDDDAPPSEGGVPLVPSSHPSLVELTRGDQIIGTPAYMAPEQLRREHTDERADQFAFCVALYEALYGVRPFEVKAEQIASAASTADATTLAMTRVPRGQPRGAKVPKWIHRVMMRGMSEDPADRWPTMEALLRALTRDPMRKWQRGAALAVALLAVGTMAVAAQRGQSRLRAMCHGGDAQAETAWRPEARGAVRRAFAATGVSYADAATRTLTRALDDYARAWAAMEDDACAASRIRGEQSEDVLDLRMTCLSDRMKELRALVDVVSHADVETVQQASRAAQSLGPVADCADIAALRAPTPRPRDRDTAAKLDELERRVAVVEATWAVGKATEATKLGDALLADARSVGFGPLTARVDFWRGRAFADLGDSDHSIPAFRDAFAEALASRSDRVLRQASSRLAQEYVYASDPKGFEAWAEVADAAIARTGPDADDEAFLANVRCVALWDRGLVLSRYECLEKNRLKIERRRAMSYWELVTYGLAASDAGQLANGNDYLRRGYALSLKENGETHPRTLEMRAYLCKGLMDYGDLEGALVECDEARKKVEAAAADNTALVGTIRYYAGEALRLMGRFDDAKRELEMAKETAPPSKTDEVLTELAHVADAQGSADALVFFKRSLDAAMKDLPATHPNVLSSELDLATAELARGLVGDARARLDHVMDVLPRAEVPPLTKAEMQFAESRAMWRSVDADAGSRRAANPDADATRARAEALAREARTAYVEHAPPTRRYQDELRRIEIWLTSPDVRSRALAPSPSGGAGEPW
jgi:tetratricopeptide (TPR) repeat protein